MIPWAALGVFAVLALVGVAAVMASSGGGGAGVSSWAAGSSGDPRPMAAGRARHLQMRVEARVSRAERRALAAVMSYAHFVTAGSRRHRVVALTFDDGPGPYTPSIVRILARMHVPATFFVVGQQLPVFSGAFRDELRHGFEVGDHTQNHAWLIRLGWAGQDAQIRSDAAAMERLGAPAVRLFRPPYGAYDARTMSVLRRLGMFMVLWSIDPGDWRRPGVRAIVYDVLSGLVPGRIVILHDGGGDRSQTVRALPAIIRGIRRRGFQLVTVPRLLALDPPPRHQQLPRLGAA